MLKGIGDASMAKTMRAGMVHTFGKPLTIDDVPIPTPGPGEVVIKVTASGVCHTDLHAANGDWAGRPPLPFIPGHEGAALAKAFRRDFFQREHPRSLG